MTLFSTSKGYNGLVLRRKIPITEAFKEYTSRSIAWKILDIYQRKEIPNDIAEFIWYHLDCDLIGE